MPDKEGRKPHWLEGSASRGTREVASLFFGEEIGPFGVLILLVITAIVIGVGWYYLNYWHLVTGAVFFFFGLAITWFMIKIGLTDRVQSNKGLLVYVVPLISGPLGWLLEHLDVWKIGNYFTLDLRFFGFLGLEVTDWQIISIPVNITLTLIVTVCVVIQTMSNRNQGRRRRR